MSYFLDKVGLQHFVEKIKSLLSGYLPLRGGTMTGSIKYGTLVSLSKDGLTCHNAQQPECSTEFDTDGLHASYTNYNHPKYGFIPVGLAKVALTGIDIWVDGKGQATLSIEECKTNKFTLYRDSSSEGLIANNSETVVKELSDEQVLTVLRKSSSSITGKHYLSEKGLDTLSQAMYDRNSKTIIQTNADTRFYSEGVSHKIPAYTNFCINSNSWTIDDPEYIKSIICRGFVDTENFYSLDNINTFDARDSYLRNNYLDSLFADCIYLTNVDIADWNTDKVISCPDMFNGCRMIPNIDLSHWDTRNITDTSRMFYGCTNLRVLNLDGWNTQSVKIMTNMFEVCALITTLNLGPGFGRMKDSVGTLDLSMMSKWTDDSVQSLLKLYNRKANGMGVITIKLSAATKNALGTSGIQTLTAKGYTIA